ncbi:hypothetical protein [Salipiger mucosus]|uniref:Uncharacterized protein n=1 Tax=Salipiger mucosus DSM 16094 TaxID=1123237 RepID=S9QAT0_9RHOB|nr:hypothetical protein [Salipiger mucosus]EPX76743.1 hypothetical protein Salmuc_04628 [Salipiger mucosus DSM 16094]
MFTEQDPNVSLMRVKQRGSSGADVVVDKDGLRVLVGVIVRAGFMAGGAIFLGGLLVLGVLLSGLPRDDTDGPVQRSGLTLHTDCGTGVQYLSRDGYLVPRRDADGNIVTTQEGC